MNSSRSCIGEINEASYAPMMGFEFISQYCPADSYENAV